ncbi:MAG: site-2 protease family protein, partial [Parcubacteria group bacterium]|nr:site-2 protease family protein [Parcubacteria group bacterium]
VSLLYINLILMLFNLIPLPPLDGSKILFSVLPNSLSYIAESLERAGPMILLMLLIINAFLPVSIFGFLFYGVNFIMDWLV